MSEGAKTSANGGGFRFKVRGPRDFYGGLALIGLAILAIWASGDLPGTHGFAFGPGTAPRLFAGLLAIVGALVALGGYSSTVRRSIVTQFVVRPGCFWPSLLLPA